MALKVPDKSVIQALAAAIGVFLVLGSISFVSWQMWLSHKSPLSSTAPVATIQPTQPQYSPVVPDPVVDIGNHLGECFRTPMGEIGKVYEQNGDMLSMKLGNGARTTYHFDQIVPFACGPVPGVGRK